MKNLSNLVMYCLAVVSCFLFSCSNEISRDKEEASHTKIIVDLEKVNKEILSTMPPETRGWSSDEKAKVVCADLTGAWGGAKAGLSLGLKVGVGIGAPHLVGGGFCALGALVGGAFSSWMQAPARAAASDDFLKIQDACRVIVAEKDFTINEDAVIIKEKNAINKINISPKILEKTRLDEKSLRIAKMHNIVLSTLDGSIVLAEPSTTEEEEVKEFILNNREFMDTCKDIGISVQKGECNFSDALSTKIITLFNEIVERYSSETDDIAFVIGKYMEVIEISTELTEEQKESIKCGLATGLYSSNYWEYKMQK